MREACIYTVNQLRKVCGVRDVIRTGPLEPNACQQKVGLFGAFDPDLTAPLYACQRGTGLEPAALPTAAGHDAGALAAAVPTAMLFVRNPTGTSHSPEETAERDDCLAGVRALATVVEELACR